MKKKHLLGIGLLGLLSGCLGIILTFGGFHGSASANNTSCKDVEFPNGVTACVNIEKISTNRRSLITQLNGGSGSYLRCDGLMTPDSLLRNPDDSFRNISSCNGEFSYNRTKVGTVKLWIKYNNTAPIDRDNKPSNNSERTYPQWAYNFNTEERAKNNVIDTNNDSNYDADNFSITASPSDPDEDEEIDITIKARDGTTIDDGYRGTVRFKVQRWDNSNDTWITASTSLYNLSKTSYTFTSSDDGKHVFSNILTFLNDSYDYRFVAYDTNNNIDETYKIFDFGNGYDGNDDNNNDSNYDADNFYVTTDDTTPAVNQQVDLTVKARDGTTIDDGYRGTVDFEVRYRQIGTTTRTKTTSLSYYEMKYPYEANGYTFNSSNDGEITITDFIRLRKKGYEYKVLVVDNDNDIEGYKVFTVNETTNNNNNTSNYNTDNFSLTTDDATPTLNQQVDLTVQARDGTTKDTTYRGKIQFEVYKKASNATIWTLTTSANDFTMISTYKSNGYTFTTSNAGQKTFSNLISFKRTNYSYKVLVYDEDYEDIQGYKIFTVGNVNTSSSNSSVDGFTTSELNTVESIYDARNNMINNLEKTYPRLINNSRRQNMSDDLYDEMGLVLDDDNDRMYSDFDEFYDAFLEWYRYTVSIK